MFEEAIGDSGSTLVECLSVCAVVVWYFLLLRKGVFMAVFIPVSLGHGSLWSGMVI